MGMVRTTSLLIADAAAEWARLLSRLEDNGATAADPAPFKSLEQQPEALTLLIEADIAVEW